MNVVHRSLRRPITVIVALVGLALTALLAIQRMPRDILPDLDIPSIILVQPYGGMDPKQMEGYITYYYEYNFLYVAGVEHIESKNIQGVSLMKIQFHPGTDMVRAGSEVINFANRALANMPQGVVPPFIMRFDAGSEPVGKLVFHSTKRPLAQVLDYAVNRVRPLLSTLPGVSAPPPIGSTPRAIVVKLRPDRLKAYNVSPNDVALKISEANKVSVSGNLQVGNLLPIVKVNSVVSDIGELERVPIRTGTYPTILVKDVATVEDGADVDTGWALVNGKRSIFMPVAKRSDASTLAVVDEVKSNLARFQDVLPDDIKVTYEFDQSGAVREAISSLMMEAILGALLTGIMVLLFLRSWRIAFIVCLNIPLALAAAVTGLWLTGQTVNIMTLGGLALAIGILVDETTITVENIHTHLLRGKNLPLAVLEATNEMIIPCFLTMLCVLAVFTPAFFMVGVAKSLFEPLAIAVGFSVLGSFCLARTFVPVISTWILPKAERHDEDKSLFAKVQSAYGKLLGACMSLRPVIITAYACAVAVALYMIFPKVGEEIFPSIDSAGFQLRLRAPPGTYFDKTEELALKALDLINKEVGAGNIASTAGNVGITGFADNIAYCWTSGPQEGVVEVNLKPGVHLDLARIQETLRNDFAEKLPELAVSFEPNGILNRVMSLGSPTPIEVVISGPELKQNRLFAEKVRDVMQTIPSLRDLQYAQVFDYPAVGVTINRELAGIRGFTTETIGESLIPATSSSRYVMKNFWADPVTGYAQQIQVEVPREAMASFESVRTLPLGINGGAVPLSRVADVTPSVMPGEIDRYNMQRIVSLTANLSGKDLGHASRELWNALTPLDKLRPRGVEMSLRGQVQSMNEIFDGLRFGLLVAITAIFLLLASNFQSVALSLVVVSSVPAVLTGVAVMLYFTGTSLNIESFMGAIMAIGVSVANSILLITFAERIRQEGKDATQAAITGAMSRLRPIVMTSCAMIVGTIPMALGRGDSGQETAPLGRAVIGGLMLSTIATLFILPYVYSFVQSKRDTKSASLDPTDPESVHYDLA